MTLVTQVRLQAAVLAQPILVLGAQRSGTTWLAKIIDSHPSVVYRHEPDKALPPPSRLTGEQVPDLIARWAALRTPSAVTKRPFFRKDWQPLWAWMLRSALVATLDAAVRLPGLARLRPAVPDLATRPARRVLLKSIALASGAGAIARTLEGSRIVFLLRHPCGQVASVMRGNRQHRFDLRTRGTDMPFDEAATIAHAARCGVTEAAFQALPDAAKYAWAWRHFNETAYAELACLPNVQVLPYERLCADPRRIAKAVLQFAGLDWHRATASFVQRSSSHQGEAGYYAVYRNAMAAAESWQREMAAADIEAVRNVVANSPLAGFWPDLAGLAPIPADAVKLA